MENLNENEIPLPLSIPPILLDSLLAEIPQWNLHNCPALTHLSSMLVRSKSQSVAPQSKPGYASPEPEISQPPSPAPATPQPTSQSASPVCAISQTSFTTQTGAPQSEISPPGAYSLRSKAVAATPKTPTPKGPLDIRNACASSAIRDKDRRDRLQSALKKYGMRVKKPSLLSPVRGIASLRKPGKGKAPSSKRRTLASDSSPLEDDLSSPPPSDDESSTDEFLKPGTNKRSKTERGPFTITKKAAPPPPGAGHILAYLAVANTEDGWQKIDNLIEQLSGEAQSTADVSHEIPSVNLLHRCRKIDGSTRLHDFHLILALVELRLALHQSGISDSDLCRSAGVATATLATYKQQGSRLLALAGGATFYVLLIIAALDLRRKITDGSVQWVDVMAASDCLRNPDETDCWGRTVLDCIVPAIHRLQHHPKSEKFSFGHTVYSVSHIQNGLSFPKIFVSFRDMYTNDEICNVLKMNSFHPVPRNMDAWNIIREAPVLFRPTATIAPVVTIKTDFAMPAKNSSPVNKANRKPWSETQRTLAENGERIESLDHLGSTLSYPDGKKIPEKYYRFSTKILQGQTASFECADGQQFALLITHLRAVIGDKVDAIPDLLNTALGEGLVPQDSSSGDYSFESINWSIFNRFSQDGAGAPTDIAHPNYCRRDNVSRSNDFQRLPKLGVDAVKDLHGYQSLVSNMTDIVKFVSDNLTHHRPDLVENWMQYCRYLPGNAHCPFAPFGGLVINLGGCSPGHCDEQDDGDHCVVIPFTKNCRGGALVLYEPGLVIELEAGDMILFPSAKLTHFNLHFQGMRASFVFHTDAAGAERWKASNHWDGNFGVQREGPH